MARKPDNPLTRAQGLGLIREIGKAFEAVRLHHYPQLIVEEVDHLEDESLDEGEFRTRLRCPWCNEEVEPGGEGLYAVDFSERWSYSTEHKEWMSSNEIAFSTGVDDYNSTLYYVHNDNCGKPVDLPDGWTEEWV